MIVDPTVGEKILRHLGLWEREAHRPAAHLVAAAADHEPLAVD